MAPSCGTQAYSACPPNRTPGIAITSSPALNLATSAPTASTTPATSSPGRGGENRTPRAGESGAAYRATSGYQDLADFADGISDERARRRLARAIRGNGAFCQFKDKLHEEDPRLLPVWHAFLAARAERRAVYGSSTTRSWTTTRPHAFLTKRPRPPLTNSARKGVGFRDSGSRPRRYTWFLTRCLIYWCYLWGFRWSPPVPTATVQPRPLRHGMTVLAYSFCTANPTPLPSRRPRLESACPESPTRALGGSLHVAPLFSIRHSPGWTPVGHDE
jgi:hypothetical protein